MLGSIGIDDQKWWFWSKSSKLVNFKWL